MNVLDTRVDLGASCIRSEHATDRATAPNRIKASKTMFSEFANTVNPYETVHNLICIYSVCRLVSEFADICFSSVFFHGAFMG